MSERYLVCEGKSVLLADGSLKRAGTILRADQIAHPKTGIVPRSMIESGHVKPFDDRPSEEAVGDLERARQIDAQMSRGANRAKMVPVFDDPSMIIDATTEELRAFAEEHLGQGRGEFQDDQEEAVRQELVDLKKVPEPKRKAKG